MKIARFGKIIFLVIAMISLSGCANMGKDFDTSNVTSIKVGVTSKSEVRGLLGTPFKVVTSPQSETWFYVRTDNNIFKMYGAMFTGGNMTGDSKSLTVEFTGDRVKTYNFTQ